MKKYLACRINGSGLFPAKGTDQANGIAHFLIRPPGLQDVLLESKSEGKLFPKLGIKNKDHQMLRTNNK